MSVQRRHAPMAITHIIHTRARPMATMDRNGLRVAYSSAPARGITATTGVVDMATTVTVATVTTGVVDMATMVAATTDQVGTEDTEAAVPVMAVATPTAQLEAAFTEAEAVAFMAGEAADGGKRPRITSSNTVGTNTASRFCLPDDPAPPF